MYTAKEVADYFIDKGVESNQPVTLMKLIKLVYIAHGWYLALNDKPLINDQVVAWKYGPVITRVYGEYKDFGKMPIKSKRPDSILDGQAHYFEIDSDEVKDFLDVIWNNYGKLSAFQLSDITHKSSTPWDIIYNQSGGKLTRNAIISNDLIKDHYQSILYNQENDAVPAQ